MDHFMNTCFACSACDDGYFALPPSLPDLTLFSVVLQL